VAKTAYNAKRAARQLDALVNRSQTQLYTHSPNDVLVQIALPLILILAITTRLTMVAHSMMAQQDTGPAVMELWKQQVILRIDREIDAWEREANLALFPDFSHVVFDDAWPEDPRFGQLCHKARELNDHERLQRSILSAALAHQADGTPGAVAELVPEADFTLEPGSPEAAYAEDYISQRLAQWSDLIAGLHWETVGHVAAHLPLADQAGANDARSQLQHIASELDKRGYPLVSSVRAEYGREEGAP
jgi:hypothetical protein